MRAGHWNCAAIAMALGTDAGAPAADPGTATPQVIAAAWKAGDQARADRLIATLVACDATNGVKL